MAKPPKKASTPTTGNRDANVINDSEWRLPMRGTTKKIELSQIEEDPQHFRREIEQSQITVIAKSLGNVGLINPVTVRLLANGNYGVIAGMGRVIAARENGETTILAIVLEDCTDSQAKQLSLRENLDRSLSDDDKKRARAELAELLTKIELERRTLDQGGGAPSRKRGRPVSPSGEGKRRAAAETGVTVRTIENAIRSTKKRTPKTVATGAAPKIDTADAEKLDNAGGDESVDDSAYQRFTKLASVFDRIRRQHLDPLIEIIAKAGPGALAAVEPKSVELLLEFVRSWKRLVAAVAPELRDKLRPAPVPPPASPVAEASTPKSSDAVTVPAPVAEQLRLNPVPPEPLDTATSSATTM